MIKSKKFSPKKIQTLLATITRYSNDGLLSIADAQTIVGVFKRPKFRNYLASQNFNETNTLIDEINTIKDGKTPLNALENLRKLSMGVWLENCSSFAIADNGDLEIQINRNEMTFSKTFNAHLHKKIESITSTFYRQATLRQIERYFLMDANGLFDDNFKPERIADIGSGTLIASAMMRDLHPQAKIIAYEPGLISEKSISIAHTKDITLINEEFNALSQNTKFDLIMLHFVLEHDRNQAKELIRDALKMLSPHGKISIGVPNFHAFHREYELNHGLSNRNPETRLSKHDGLSGHQVIFSADQLNNIITEIQQELGFDFAVNTKTILPRPLSFNQILSHTKNDKILHEMENRGHPIDQYGHTLCQKGSVLAITIGKTGHYETPQSGTIYDEIDTPFQSLLLG